MKSLVDVLCALISLEDVEVLEESDRGAVEVLEPLEGSCTESD